MQRHAIHPRDLGFAQDDSGPLRLLCEAGHFWLRLGDLNRAERCFEALSILCVDDPAGPLGRAQVLLARGDCRRALSAADEVLRRGQAGRASLVLAMFLRGDALLLRRRRGEAVRQYRMCIEFGGDDPVAQAARKRLELINNPLKCLQPATASPDHASSDNYHRLSTCHPYESEA